MFRIVISIMIGLLAAGSAASENFRRYANARFGYAVDLPADFKTVSVLENSDGISLESSDGRAKISVWGNHLTEGGFFNESELRKNFENDDGWKFTYEKRGASWASVSGVKGDRIIYLRQIALCDDTMGNFRIEY